MTARRYGLALAVAFAGGFADAFIASATGIDQLGSMVGFASGAAFGVLLWGGDQ